MKTLVRRVTAEFFGTLFLVAAVVGSGVMSERLSAGNVAIALLCNTIATQIDLVIDGPLTVIVFSHWQSQFL